MPVAVAETLIQLWDHFDTFIDRMPELAAEGPFWWFRPSDNTFHATAQKAEGVPGDFYLFYALPEWVEQWGGDWDAAGLDLLTALNAAMKLPVDA